MDVLLAAGEQVSIALLAMALKERGCDGALLSRRSRCAIHTEAVHNKARITHVETSACARDLAAGIVPVVAGFQGVDATATSRRSAAAARTRPPSRIAVALGAGECQILSDVAGVYTTDPRLVPEAQLVQRLSFEEMLELASQGSKILADPRRRVRGQVPHAAARACRAPAAATAR